MKKDFFADKNWPYALQVSGSFVHSPRESLNTDRFVEHRFYHHFSSALADMLSLSGKMFEQELLPHGPKSSVYKDVAIIHTDTRQELVSYLSLPLSSAVATGEFAGLYLAFADPAQQMAAKYKLPLDRLSHYDPESILQLVADYDSNHKNFIRVDPKMEQVTSLLTGKQQAEGKDTHQLHTAYHTQGGGFSMDVSHHFNGLAAGMDGLLHYPLFGKTPTIDQTLAMTRSDTVLRSPDGEIATIAFEHYKDKGQTPPAGFHLSFNADPAQLQKSLGIKLSDLPAFHRAGKDHYIIALAEGGRPVEVAAFTALRVKFHDHLLVSRNALKRQTGGQGKTIFPGPGKPFSL